MFYLYLFLFVLLLSYYIFSNVFHTFLQYFRFIEIVIRVTNNIEDHIRGKMLYLK
jgi:hypothetical protein